MNYIEILAIKYKMHPPVIRDIKDTKNSMGIILRNALLCSLLRRNASLLHNEICNDDSEDSADEADVQDGEDLDAAEDAEDVIELLAYPVRLQLFTVEIDPRTAPELKAQVEL